MSPWTFISHGNRILFCHDGCMIINEFDEAVRVSELVEHQGHIPKAHSAAYTQ
jgi:hypothetical protein